MSSEVALHPHRNSSPARALLMHVAVLTGLAATPAARRASHRLLHSRTRVSGGRGPCRPEHHRHRVTGWTLAFDLTPGGVSISALQATTTFSGRHVL